jgi:hypothetical protein
MEQEEPLFEAGGERTRADDEPGGVDWDKIKHAYIHGDWSLDRIADAYGSSASTITARAKKHGWVRLVGTKPLPCGRRARLPGAPRPKRANVDQLRRRTIIRRLLEVLDGKLTELETRMEEAQATGAPHSAADGERDARSLTALARLYAKLVELDDAAKQATGQGSETETRRTGDDADRLRRDLALRLQRLYQAGDA